jgi:hypothetical protein
MDKVVNQLETQREAMEFDNTIEQISPSVVVTKSLVKKRWMLHLLGDLTRN